MVDPNWKAFFPINSQSSDADKLFILKAREIVKRIKPNYTYLEIGSFLGGSLTPFLLDEQCSSVFSVDDRGRAQPDERGLKFDYAGITHDTMIQNLNSHGIATDKLKTFDGSIDDLKPSPGKFDMAFIDGEHTDLACFRDFLWTEPLLERDAILLFHDTTLVYRAINHVLLYMKRSDAPFVFVKNKESEMSAVLTGQFSAINPAEFGAPEDWNAFCALAEKKNLQSIIGNRVKFSFEVGDIRTVPAY